MAMELITLLNQFVISVLTEDIFTTSRILCPSSQVLHIFLLYSYDSLFISLVVKQFKSLFILFEIYHLILMK